MISKLFSQDVLHHLILTIQLMLYIYGLIILLLMNITKRNSKQSKRHYMLFTAKDQYPKNVSKQDIDRVLARKRSETHGLDHEIRVKEGARIMLTANINIQDRLINGQMGTVVKIDVNMNNEPAVLYIKFDDEKAGKTTINNSGKSFAKKENVVPIEQTELAKIEQIELAKIKVRPGKASSPELQRCSFLLHFRGHVLFTKSRVLLLKVLLSV